MASGLVLHSTKINKNAYKVLIAAEYVGVKVESTPEFQMGVTNKTPEFLKLNPIGKCLWGGETVMDISVPRLQIECRYVRVFRQSWQMCRVLNLVEYRGFVEPLKRLQKIPVLETQEGPIFESNAIARYVAGLKDVGLFGSSAYEKALVEQWIDFSSLEIDPHGRRWVYPRLGRGVFNEEVEALEISKLKRAYTALNSYLATRTYLVGNAVTLADIVLACNLIMPFLLATTKEFTAEYPHIERCFWTLVNQPNFKKVLGDGVTQATEPLGPPPPKGEFIIPPVIAEQRKKEQEATKQPEAAPKAKKPDPAPKPAPARAETLEDEEEPAPVKKTKNALDLLPPSPMVLDNWKRLYSNTKAKDFHLAINGFWEMFDPEGYSLWFCDYKYNDENQVPFVTMNKVGGFLQRMDLARKYAFAKMCILGDSAPYKIKGVWLFRGADVPQMVKEECYDVELYEWTKVNITDKAQKALVNAYFEEPDEINGEKLLECKCFK